MIYSNANGRSVSQSVNCYVVFILLQSGVVLILLHNHIV